MTQIEQKHANAAAKQETDGGNLPIRKATPLWLSRTNFHQLSAANPFDILERWSSGETLNAIAEEHSVTPSALTRWLQRNASAEDREMARELHYQTRLDDGLNRLELAEADVNLARAREATLRRLEWRAQVECRRWQQKPQTAIQVNGDGMAVSIVSYASNNSAENTVESSDGDPDQA